MNKTVPFGAPSVWKAPQINAAAKAKTIVVAALASIPYMLPFQMLAPADCI